MGEKLTDNPLTEYIAENENTPLRILIVTECFWPDIYAVNEITATLVGRGHKVTVLTGLPDYTTSYIPPEYKHGKNRHQSYEGAEVLRVSTVARRHGPIWRSLSYLSFAFNGSLKARFHDFEEFDIIYVWEVSPVTMAVPALTLKKRYHKPLFLYCMDIWPECVKAMSIHEGSLAFKLIHAWTKRIYAGCDHIAVSSDPFFEYLSTVNGVKSGKMSYLPQFGDETLLEFDTVKSGGGCDLLFIGNIGKAQNIDCLIKAMCVFKGRSDVKLHMVGGGSEYERIRELTKTLGLEDIITFYGPVSFKDSFEFYKKADACVLTLDGSTRIGDTLPGKLQTYMAAGKPVIAAANGACMSVIKESGCGECVAAGDHEGLGRVLLQFAEDKEHYSSCGDKAREYFRSHFTKEMHFETLEARLRAMISEADGRKTK